MIGLSRVHSVLSVRPTWAGAAALLGLAMAVAGCGSARVIVTQRPGELLVKPDFILVNDLAVSTEDVKLDKGIAASAVRDAKGRPQSEDEVRAGRLTAEALSKALVDDLQKLGIQAHRPQDGVQPTAQTFVIKGQFVQVDQGNQTLRVWVGFGLGATDLRANLQGYQGGRLIAGAQTSANSGGKPGMIVPLGVGGLTENLGRAAVVGGATTAASETWMATVQADARRTAREIAKEIGEAYVRRGWLPARALDNLKGIF